MGECVVVNHESIPIRCVSVPGDRAGVAGWPNPNSGDRPQPGRRWDGSWGALGQSGVQG